MEMFIPNSIHGRTNKGADSLYPKKSSFAIQKIVQVFFFELEDHQALTNLVMILIGNIKLFHF